MYSLALFLIIVLIPAMVIPKNIAAKERPYKVILEALIATSVGILFLFVVATATGASLGEQLAAMVDNMIPALMTNEGFLGNPIFSKMTPAEVQIQLSLIYAMMINSLPGYLLVMASLTSYFEYTFIAKLMSGKIRDVRKLPVFSTFSWPKSGAWGWLIIYGGSLILSNTFDIGPLVLRNVQILMEYYFFVQGAAVVFFFGARKKWPKFVPPLLVVALSISPISRGIIFILGLTDLIINIRNRIDQMVR
jgi:uncharacterized protein YybS (DUF2232 family)